MFLSCGMSWHAGVDSSIVSGPMNSDHIKASAEAVVYRLNDATSAFDTHLARVQLELKGTEDCLKQVGGCFVFIGKTYLLV
jgi:hypothetical protein